METCVGDGATGCVFKVVAILQRHTSLTFHCATNNTNDKLPETIGVERFVGVVEGKREGFTVQHREGKGKEVRVDKKREERRV